MQVADLSATSGVFLLLLAFALNLTGWLERGSVAYQSMNVIGAGLACYAAVLIAFWPFVVLEGSWAVVAAVAIVNRLVRKPRRMPEQLNE